MQNRRPHLAIAWTAGAIVMFHAAVAIAAPLTLADVVERALKFAPSVSAAEAQSAYGDAREREQFAPLLPAISAGVEYYQAPGYSEVITNRGQSAALLALNYTAWDWGRRSARYHAARYAAQAATLGIAAARAQIVFDATVGYYELLRAGAVERELQSSLVRLDRYVATIEQLRRSGRAVANDVLKIRSARDAGELGLASARADRRRASASLGALIGESGPSEVEIADVSGIAEKPTGSLADSPALQAARRAVSGAELQVKAAQAERLPTFQIALSSGFLGIDPPATVTHNGGASYDGVISMPVFEGGLIGSHIDQAKAKQRSASAQLRQTEYLLTRRIADASVRYDEARDALEILNRAQPTADDAFALAWTRFLGGGNTTLLEVLDAYQQAEQLKLNRFDREFAAREAAAENALLYGRSQ